MKTARKMLAAVAGACALAGCVSQTSVENKLPDQSAPSDPAFRAKLHTERASEYFKVGSYGIAIEAAQTAIQHVPGYAPAHNMLGVIYMQLKQDDKAQLAFEQAIRFAPADPEVLNNYGWFICERRNPKDAMPYFETALRNPLYISPERALHNAGYCSRKAGNNVVAEANLRAALNKSPMYAPSLLALAELLYDSGRMKEADALLARYLQVLPAPPVEGLSLAVKLARVTGEKSNEASYIQQMRRRFPNDPRTREAIEGR